MMGTYFHLIEEGAATKEDRALTLAALSRPASGHGQDNADPPNFTELDRQGNAYMADQP